MTPAGPGQDVGRQAAGVPGDRSTMNDTTDTDDDPSTDTDDEHPFPTVEDGRVKSDHVIAEFGEGEAAEAWEFMDEITPHPPDLWGVVQILLPTAEIERILVAMEDTKHDSVADYIRGALYKRLHEDRPEAMQVQSDIEVPEDVWRDAQLDAAASVQRGKDPSLAFFDALDERAPHAPNYVLEGSHPSDGPLHPDDLPVVVGDADDHDA